MFTDRRSKKIILVAQCILNQNAKIDGCAHYPGAIEGVAEVLIRSGCGIVQLPCPEVMHLGLDRVWINMPLARLNPRTPASGSG